MAGITYRVCLDRTEAGSGLHAEQRCRLDDPGRRWPWTRRPGDTSLHRLRIRRHAGREGRRKHDLGAGNAARRIQGGRSLSSYPQPCRRRDDAAAPTAAVGQVAPQAVKLAGLASPAVHFSSVKKQDGPFAAVYEAFHYMKPPRAMDLTCTVIKALGDKFDMLAYYSDFRIDNPEAGTSSTGPLGGGPAGGAVTGIGANQRNLAGYCTQGPLPVAVHPAGLRRRQPDAGVSAGRSEGNEHA